MTVENSLNRFIESLHLSEAHKEILDYNLTGGKFIRAFLYESTLTALQQEVHPDLMWCIEILQAYFLITDDMIDNSLMRRNKPSWFFLKGSKALNHAVFLQCLIFDVCKKHNNTRIIELFQECTLKTWMGQAHDTIKKDIQTFDDVLRYYTFKNYNDILVAKTCYYTLVLPIKLGFLCANKDLPLNFDIVCQKFAFLMQFQDDYLNFFPELSGKSGTDVEEKKITWYMCKMVEENKNDVVFQRSMMDYLLQGECDYIYDKIKDLVKSHSDYEEELMDEILPMIKDQPYFEFLYSKLYKRRK